MNPVAVHSVLVWTLVLVKLLDSEMPGFVSVQLVDAEWVLELNREGFNLVWEVNIDFGLS